jgi:O-glycosyl hydrolase
MKQNYLFSKRSFFSFLVGVVTLAFPYRFFSQAKPILIQPQIQLQRMEGFGVSIANGCAREIRALPEADRARLLGLLFGADGAHLNIVRTEIWWTGKRLAYTHPLYISGLVYSFGDEDNESAQYSVVREILKKYEVLLNACVWSPPPAWKSNHAYQEGGALLTEKYEDFAEYLYGYLNFYKSLRSLDFFALTLQNAPDQKKDQQSCVWTGDQLKNFTKILGNKFKQRKVPTRIMVPDSEWDQIGSYLSPLLEDRDLKETGFYLSAHSYKESIVFRNAVRELSKKNNLKLWQTEYATPPGYEGMEDGLRLAGRILEDLNQAECTAWLYGTVFPTEVNRAASGLVARGQPSFQLPRRFWCYSQFSRFISRDYVRISTSGGTLPVTAFRNPLYNGITIVFINPTVGEVSEKIELRGWTMENSKVWRTSDKEDCLPIAVPVQSGAQYSLALPPLSVTTLVAQLHKTP